MIACPVCKRGKIIPSALKRDSFARVYWCGVGSDIRYLLLRDRADIVCSKVAGKSRYDFMNELDGMFNNLPFIRSEYLNRRALHRPRFVS